MTPSSAETDAVIWIVFGCVVMLVIGSISWIGAQWDRQRSQDWIGEQGSEPRR